MLKERIVRAEKYLKLVDSTPNGDWGELRTSALAEQDLPTAMALIHPVHWTDHVEGKELQGPRGFEVRELLGSRSCNAADYWGVTCSRKPPKFKIVADHAWPYSLGGPTVPENIRWLCSMHNAAKSSDIHLYPWEAASWPTWLNDFLDKVERERSNTSPG